MSKQPDPKDEPPEPEPGADQRRDDVLKRMLKTPPRPHDQEPKRVRAKAPAPKDRARGLKGNERF